MRIFEENQNPVDMHKLKILDISKASGPDAVSPRLLKEATQILKSPFVDFLIYLLELEYFLLIGNVPFSKKIPQVTMKITDLYL